MGEGSVEKVFPSKYVIGVNNLEMGIKSRYYFNMLKTQDGTLSRSS